MVTKEIIMSSLRSYLQIAPQDVFTSSSTQGTDLGALATTGDGRVFRYVLAGATALVPGKLQQASAQDTTNLNPSGGLSIAAASVGATSVVTTSTVTLTANQLAGGYLSVAVTPGLGYTYKIKGNTAATAAVTTIYLEDPILVALTTSSKIVLAASPYANVIVNPATASSAPVGVAVYPVVAAQYGWIQTHGPVSLLNDGGTAVGLGLAPSASVAGAAKTMAATLCQIGYALNVQVTTEYDLAFLTID